MKIRATFPQVESLAAVASLREAYLDGLPEAQAALLELMVAQGRVHGILAPGRGDPDALSGYFVVLGDTLVELFVVPALQPYAHVLLEMIVRALGVRSALVKSFDHLFLSSALDLHCEVVVRGVLVRGYRRAELPDIARVHYTQRVATEDDLPRILAVEQDVFTSPERLRDVLSRQQVILFERGPLELGSPAPVGDTLLGFGVLRTVIPSRPHVEVGIAVDAPYRNKGYAVFMLRDLADHCVARGLVPVSACARSNEASIRTGARAGFSSRHRLLEVRFPGVESSS